MIIKLTQGKETIIDNKNEDLAGFNWYSSHGYAVRTVYNPKQTVSLSKTILERKLNRSLERGEEPDHKDGNKYNNLESNIRLATRSSNNANRFMFKNNSSGFRGVERNGNGWRAAIRINGIRHNLGTYPFPEQASKVFLARYFKEHGEYPLEVR